MEALFFDISAECRRYTFQKEDFNLTAFKNLLTKWERELKKNSVGELIELHNNELSRVKKIMLDMTKTFPEIRGFYDRIFKNILRLENYTSTLSIIFAGFIKGITFFAYQQTSPRKVPVYHRLYACGTGDDAFRHTFNQCTESMNKDMRKDIRRRIETCYIERLIYDHMFRHQTLHFPPMGSEEPSQDKGHLFRLELTKSDFKTCFPNLDIEIDIEYDGMWPVILTIKRSIRGHVVSTEIYEKQTEFLSLQSGIRKYVSFVECTKKTDTTTYIAVNRFEMQGAWKKI